MRVRRLVLLLMVCISGYVFAQNGSGGTKLSGSGQGGTTTSSGAGRSGSSSSGSGQTNRSNSNNSATSHSRSDEHCKAYDQCVAGCSTTKSYPRGPSQCVIDRCRQLSQGCAGGAY